jgi:adenylate cyclase
VPPERIQQKLAAILVADVAGHSRLMGADEEGTVARLMAHGKELMEPEMAEHRGDIVKTTGDGMLVEFPSVVDACECTVKVQRGIMARNAETFDEKRIEFRAGMNVRDIIIDSDDVHGDGVNVAARLEGLAELGGICISHKVREEVGDKLDLPFEDLGEKSLNNIAKPLRVYPISLAWAEAFSPYVRPEHRARYVEGFRLAGLE